MKNKKGTQIMSIVITMVVLFVVVGVGIALSSFVFGNIKSTQTENSLEWNTTNAVSEGVGIVADLTPGIGAVIGGLIIVAVIMVFIYNFTRR